MAPKDVVIFVRNSLSLEQIKNVVHFKRFCSKVCEFLSYSATRILYLYLFKYYVNKIKGNTVYKEKLLTCAILKPSTFIY